jgi:hypothetical protein
MSGIVSFDDAAGCLRTYATLRIYSGEIAPREISKMLGVEPSRVWNKGSTETAVPRKQNGWFLTSRGEVESLDSKRHVDFILSQLAGNKAYVTGLTKQGLQVDIMCLWQSANQSEGGPSLLPAQMQLLAEMGIAIAWNIYVDRNSEAS